MAAAKSGDGGLIPAWVLGRKRYVFGLLMFFFAISLAVLYAIYARLPALEENQRQHVRIPFSIEELRDLRDVALEYTDEYYYEVLSLFCAVYLIMQSFTIPGSTSLSVLAGALFGLGRGFVVVSVVAAVGASVAFFFSWLLGKRLVVKYFPENVDKLHGMVLRHERHLFNYMLFLRMTPILPNWTINWASPVLAVPFWTFWWATFIGMMPATFLYVKSGLTLHEMTSTGDAIPINALLTLCGFGVVTLLPAIFRKQVEAWLGNGDGDEEGELVVDDEGVVGRRVKGFVPFSFTVTTRAPESVRWRERNFVALDSDVLDLEPEAWVDHLH